MEPVIFIGYDSREREAFEVCAWTIAKYASCSPRIEGVYMDQCQDFGIYSREYTMRNGVRYDKTDGLPFSTEFSFTRFLTPFLASYYEFNDAPWVLFVDCDFMFLDDVAKLFLNADPQYALMVCKHQYEPTETIKMDGQIQSSYNRKNWSSLMLWNMRHRANEALTVDDINAKPGSWLHSFSWLKDKHIGEIPIQWNWLEGVYNTRDHDYPKAVHFTRGGPWFRNYMNVEYGYRWFQERDAMNNFLALIEQNGLDKDTSDESEDDNDGQKSAS